MLTTVQINTSRLTHALFDGEAALGEFRVAVNSRL
jgi:hypothetical protein